MSSILSSQGVVFATAMVVSATVLFLAFSKQKTLPHHPSQNHDSDSLSQNLRSCLHTEGKRKNKKKRVRFADNVKDTKRTGGEYRREKMNSLLIKRLEKMNVKDNSDRTGIDGGCRNEIQGIHGMPANRIALYNGILRDRMHRMECSF